MSILKFLFGIFFNNKNSNQLIGNIFSQLLGNSGDLNGLISRFSKGGLEDIINSWVGTGANKEISVSQLKNVFESTELQNLGKSVGLSENNLLSELKKYLPLVIDKMTPDGRVEGNQLDFNSVLNVIKSLNK